MGLFTEVADGTPSILGDPEPTALFNGFGESSLDFELRAWTANIEDWRRIKSEMSLTIHRALGEADIAIPFPQRDLHLRSIEPELRTPGSAVDQTSSG